MTERNDHRGAQLRLVGGKDGELPEYPIDISDRLTSHYFVAWHFDRWLNSELRLTAEPAVKGLALDLFFLSQKQSPVGTLPDDNRQLAALLMLHVDEWVTYRRKAPSPLYKWVPCLCENEIRLMHPVVLEVIQDAFSHRSQKREAAEQARRAKRLMRLRDMLERNGAGHIARSDADVERLDAYLEQHCSGRRTAAQILGAVEANVHLLHIERPP